jgi:hypothetical protein
MPGPSLKALTTGDCKRGTWTWYQWWLAVSINTKTRVSLRRWPLANYGNQMCSHTPRSTPLVIERRLIASRSMHPSTKMKPGPSGPSFKQQATSNKQQATSNKQQATSNKQHASKCTV